MVTALFAMAIGIVTATKDGLAPHVLVRSQRNRHQLQREQAWGWSLLLSSLSLAFSVSKDKKVHSYVAQYPVLKTAQNALRVTPGTPVNSNAISTSPGSIQPRCNYWAKNIRSDIHLYQVLIYTAEWTVAMWDERNC